KLLHQPTVSLEDATDMLVVGPKPRPHILGISRLGGSRKPHQVGEEHTDDLPLLGRQVEGSVEGRRARAAEAKPSRVLVPAARAGWHASSLGEPIHGCQMSGEVPPRD